MYLLARVRTRTGTSCAVLCWTARATHLLALVRTRTGTSCAVLRLDSTVMYLLARVRTRTGVRMGNVPTYPCSYSYWYLLCSASLGQHGMYLVARGRTRTGASCAVLRLDSTGYVPMCPCLYPCTVFVQCFARAMYLLARGRTRTGVRTGNLPTCPWSYSYWYLLCGALLEQHGYVPMCPCLYPCTVFVQCFARAMYLLAGGRTRTGVRTGNVPICPWSYSYWYLLCSVSLGQHGLYTYMPVLVSLYIVCYGLSGHVRILVVLVSARVM